MPDIQEIKKDIDAIPLPTKRFVISQKYSSVGRNKYFGRLFLTKQDITEILGFAPEESGENEGDGHKWEFSVNEISASIEGSSNEPENHVIYGEDELENILPEMFTGFYKQERFL